MANEHKGPPPTALIRALGHVINEHHVSLDEGLFALQVIMAKILHNVTPKEMDAHTNLDTVTNRVHDMLADMYRGR